MAIWWILSEVSSCLCLIPSELKCLSVLYHEAHEILSILQRPKARVNLSSGHTDESISVSVSSYKAPELSNLDVPNVSLDDRSHYEPSGNVDMRDSIKNAETNQSIVLTQCDLMHWQLNFIHNFCNFTMSLSCQITVLIQLCPAATFTDHGRTLAEDVEIEHSSQVWSYFYLVSF